ncbi:unnamed protein product [Adineta steineri]|uniref:Uncharacterized protein n=1 Tax=Adineta steineri TaxID=433720 RepID=A0A816FX02_9BILA|nr:unnamed protein product [Adineta steineri]CAF1666545.1 unnamed protein product [Adineta steineri]
MIEQDKHARLQVHILYNETRPSSNLSYLKEILPFGSSFKSTLYLGGLLESFQLFHRRMILSSRIIEFRLYSTYIYIGSYHYLCSYNEQYCRTYCGC